MPLQTQCSVLNYAESFGAYDAADMCHRAAQQSLYRVLILVLCSHLYMILGTELHTSLNPKDISHRHEVL